MCLRNWAQPVLSGNCRMSDDLDRILKVWNQSARPVIVRNRKGVPVRVRLGRTTFEWADRSWLKNNRPRRPKFNYERNCWEIPAAWFNDTVERCLDRFSQVYVIQPYRAQEKCAPACQNAKGHECQCSCMGQNHGVSNDGNWFEVSETFATRWGDEHMAARLLTRT